MKALVGAFNQVSVIVQLHQLIDLRHWGVATVSVCCDAVTWAGTRSMMSGTVLQSWQLLLQHLTCFPKYAAQGRKSFWDTLRIISIFLHFLPSQEPRLVRIGSCKISLYVPPSSNCVRNANISESQKWNMVLSDGVLFPCSVPSSAANQLIGEVVQSRRRPLLGPSPGWKRLLALSHLRHY